MNVDYFLNFLKAAHEDAASVVDVFGNGLEESVHFRIYGLAASWLWVMLVRARKSGTKK